MVEIKKQLCEEKNIQFVPDHDSSSYYESDSNFNTTPKKPTQNSKLNINLPKNTSLSPHSKTPGLPIIEEQLSSQHESSRQLSVSNMDEFKNKFGNVDKINIPRNQSAEPSDGQSNFGKSQNMLGKKKVNDEEHRRALAYKQLGYGQVFLKYGKYGYPKQKHVFFDGKSIKWRANTKEGH